MEEVLGPGFVQDGGQRTSMGGDPLTLKMENLQGWRSPNCDDGDSLRRETLHNQGWRSANPKDEDSPQPQGRRSPQPKDGDPTTSESEDAPVSRM